jgi:hypothetical protein
VDPAASGIYYFCDADNFHFCAPLLQVINFTVSIPAGVALQRRRATIFISSSFFFVILNAVKNPSFLLLFLQQLRYHHPFQYFAFAFARCVRPVPFTG